MVARCGSLACGGSAHSASSFAPPPSLGNDLLLSPGRNVGGGGLGRLAGRTTLARRSGGQFPPFPDAHTDLKRFARPDLGWRRGWSPRAPSDHKPALATRMGTLTRTRTPARPHAHADFLKLGNNTAPPLREHPKSQVSLPRLFQWPSLDYSFLGFAVFLPCRAVGGGGGGGGRK